MKKYNQAKSKVKKRVKSYKILVWATLGFSGAMVIVLLYNLISNLI
tara:strand:- start:186 stop:323 length:138 start_codon:yes stop_codon:yes gene_type:complete